MPTAFFQKIIRIYPCILSTSIGIICTSFSSQTHSAGFALIENNASGQGNAYAGAAAHANDASTIWFNPAGMMRLQKDHLLIANHYIRPSSEFINEGSTTATGSPLLGGNDDGGRDAFIANFYWVKTLTENTKFGLGVTTPVGLATKYDDTWVGRYHAVETDVKALNFNPSIAYQVDDKISVGIGLNILFTDVILNNAIDFGSLVGAPQAADGLADLEADNLDSPDLGYNIGFLFQVTPETRIGLSYRSEIKLKVKGDAKFSAPGNAPLLANLSNATGAFVDTELESTINLPQSFSASMAREIGKVTLLADVTWTAWKSFDELRIKFANPAQPDAVTTESWENARRYSAGFDWQYSSNLTLRSGIAYDETPIPSAALRTPRVPGNSRRWVSIGGSYAFSDAVVVDLGYSHLFINDTSMDNTLESSQAVLNANLKGSYDAGIDILSAQVRWNY